MATDLRHDDWDLRPIDSASGTSYMGRIGSRKVFVKINAHPLVPSIANIGLTPKVLWIRKMGDGDTMIAQSWVEGHTLKVEEMMDPQVNEILLSLHTSRKLHDNLTSFDKTIFRPHDLLSDLVSNPNSPLINNEFLRGIIETMMKNIPNFNPLNNNVIHGDLSRDNWMMEDKTKKIYLMDWDGVCLGDSFVDLGHVISHYIPHRYWSAWLSSFGYSAQDISVIAKVIWYGRLSFLRRIDSHFKKGNTAGANSEILGLRKFNENF